MTAPVKRATVDDLMRHDGKAELIDGRLVTMSPTGFRPGRIAFLIGISLHDFGRRSRLGVAVPDNVGYRVPMLRSGRETFSPDMSFFTGPLPANPMRFLEGAPVFAVEVRSENDYGSYAEGELAEKRADYFEAGTLVVWDVDPLADLVRRYVRGEEQPTVFGLDEFADAEPAVPGWTVSVDDVFEEW
jgi:Uma2 family endonuclease